MSDPDKREPEKTDPVSPAPAPPKKGPRAKPAPEPTPPLRLAARGLALVFTATGFQCLAALSLALLYEAATRPAPPPEAPITPDGEPGPRLRRPEIKDVGRRDPRPGPQDLALIARGQEAAPPDDQPGYGEAAEDPKDQAEKDKAEKEPPEKDKAEKDKGEKEPEAPTPPAVQAPRPALAPVWLLAPSLVWVLMAWPELAGRLLCRKAGASRLAKRILGYAIVLSVLTLLFNLTLSVFFVLDRTGALPLERLTDPGRQALFWLPLLAPALGVVATGVFVLYLHGLARAHEYYEFIEDTVVVVALGLSVYVIAALFAGLCLLIASILNFGPDDYGMAKPFFYLILGLWMLWPFFSYTGLLLRFREVLLRQTALDADPARKHEWPT